MQGSADDILIRHIEEGNRKYTPRDQGDLQESLTVYKQRSPRGGYIYSLIWDSDHGYYANKRKPFVKKVIAYAVRKFKKDMGERASKEWVQNNIKISRIGTRKRKVRVKVQ